MTRNTKERSLAARLRRTWRRLRPCLDVALMFLFLYNVSFLAAPSATTGRLVLLALFIAYRTVMVRQVRAFCRANWAWVIVFALMVAHVVLVSALGGAGDYAQVSRLVNFAIFALVGALAFMVHLEGDALAFARTVALAVLVQSVFVFISYLSPAYRIWLANLVVEGGNIPLTSPVQAPGFSNSSGAALSVLQMLGVFAALYVSRLDTSGPRSLAYALIACINLSSTLLIGRTGLLMGLLSMVAFFLGSLGKRGLVRLGAAVIGLSLAAMIWGNDLLALVETVNPALADTMAHSMSVLIETTADPTVIDLATRPIPPLSIDTVVGTGRVVDPVSTASGHDSGYIQTYFAAGLIVTVLFYGAWLALVLKYVLAAPHRGLLGILVVIMLFIELKEPFIFKYALPFVLLTLAMSESGVAIQTRLPRPFLAPSS